MLIVVMLLAVAFALFGMSRLWSAYRDISQGKLVDVSAENRPLPLNTLEFYETLLAVGFQPIGQIAMRRAEKEVIIWILVNESSTTTATLSATPRPVINFRTIFEDFAALETTFPLGLDIQRPNYLSMRSTTDIPTAVNQHHQAMQGMIAIHGSPIVIETVQTYSEWYAIYREHHIYSGRMGRSLRNYLLATSYAVYIVLWLLILRGLILNNDGLTTVVVVGMGILTLPAAYFVLLTKGV